MATGKDPLQELRLTAYPIGVIVRVRMISGREVEARIAKIETTELGTFLHVEFGEEVAKRNGSSGVGLLQFVFHQAPPSPGQRT